MKKKLLGISLALLLAAGGGAAYYSAKKKQDAVKEDKRIALPVKRQTLDVTMKAYGSVEPGNRVEIKPPVSGSVDTILVEEGDFVKEGKILAWMSSTDRSIIVSAARASSQEEMRKLADIYKPIPIVAPISGTIIANNIKPAQTINASDAIFVMSDKLVVRVLIDEVDIPKVQKGQTVDVSVDAVQDSKVSAKVKRIGYDAKRVNNVNKYVVDLDLKETPAYLLSGMTANLLFHLKEKAGVIAVPRRVLRKEDGQWLVDISKGRDKKGAWTSEERKVKTGEQTDDLIEIVSGLNEGEEILAEAEDASKGKDDDGEIKLSDED